MNGWYPENLFRYRPTTSKHFADELEQLKENKVWLSFLNTQNDPFEGCISHRVNSYEEFCLKNKELREALLKRFPDDDILPATISEQEFNKCTNQSPQFHDKVLQQAVIACFSKGWQNTLLWGHYAEDFKGICLQFTANPLAEAEGPSFFPVQYWKEEPPEFLPFDFFVQTRLSVKLKELETSKCTSNELRQTLLAVAHEKTKLALTSKSFDWVYEEEFRMLAFKKDPGYYRVPGMKLTSVIFGPRAEALTYSTVMDALGDDIQYFKMDLRPNSYSYERTPVYSPEQLSKRFIN